MSGTHRSHTSTEKSHTLNIFKDAGKGGGEKQHSVSVEKNKPFTKNLKKMDASLMIFKYIYKEKLLF